MTTIVGEILKTEREKKNLSLSDLERLSKINRQTIYRIEVAKQKGVRPQTIRQLADALHVDPKVLTGEVEPRIAASKKPDMFAAFETQFNVRISKAARNAYSFMKMKYGVSASEIAALAPFLFNWAAERSLGRRRERLDALLQRQSEIEDLRENFHHLHFSIVGHWTAENSMSEEGHSIKVGDIFGREIKSNEFDGLREDYEEDSDNPMVVFLKDLAMDIGEEAEFSRWLPGSGPEYSIGRKQAATVIGADEQALADLLSSAVALSEMPTDIQKQPASERARWVREQADVARATLPELDLDTLEFEPLTGSGSGDSQ